MRTHPEQGSRFSISRSPLGLLNAFCCVTALGWLALLAITFSDRTTVILLATLGWLGIAGLTILLTVALARSHLPWKRAVVVLLLWITVTLIVSNSTVTYWQSQQRLWSGFVFDPRYGWYPEAGMRERKLLIPGGSYVASTDGRGHRNTLPYPDDGRLPTILQGDSNAFGFGLAEDQTLSAILNSILPEMAVYNVGVLGFDLNHYYFQYAELAQEFQIGHRIILWNVGNDFTLSALETPNYFRRPYLFVDQSKVCQAADFRSPFPVQGYGQSFIPPYQDLNPLIQTIADDWADIYPESLIRLALSRQLIRTYHPKICRAVELALHTQQSLELFNPGWMLLKRELWPAPFDQYANDLPLLLRQLKQQNSRLTLCAFPFREQVITDESKAKIAALKSAGYSDDVIDPLAFNRYLKTICDAESIELVDPTPRFLKAASPISLYQPGDQHLSELGMRLCAEEIVRHESVHQSQGK